MLRALIARRLSTLVVPAAAAPYAVRLDALRPARRRRRRRARTGVVPVHPIRAAFDELGPDGRVALRVDIIGLDRAYADHLFDAGPDQSVPAPVLLEHVRIRWRRILSS